MEGDGFHAEPMNSDRDFSSFFFPPILRFPTTLPSAPIPALSTLPLPAPSFPNPANLRFSPTCLFWARASSCPRRSYPNRSLKKTPSSSFLGFIFFLKNVNRQIKKLILRNGFFRIFFFRSFSPPSPPRPSWVMCRESEKA